jgi:4-amino-4-deoxy-L-arabinose transferase-like glycosyltransferase
MFFFGLGRLALVGPDEPRYAEVAREMFASGDYISPRLCGCLWFEKPALLYWMAAGAYHLLGVCEFAARSPSALAALVTVLFLYAVAHRHVTAGVAFGVSLALVTSAIFIGYARAATTDMLLAASMSVAVLSAFACSAEYGRRRWYYLALSAAATGLAVLAKGLVGVALVAAIIGIYYLASGRLRSIGWKEALVVAAIFLAVAATWYLPVTLKHGQQFVQEFIYDHHFKRYVSNKYNHPQPIYFYFFVTLAGVIPWTLFFIPAFGRLRSLRRKASGRDALLLLAWIWMAVPLVFFSFSTSKLPGYVLPIFPAAAIIIGSEIERVWSGERTPLLRLASWSTALVLLLIASAFIVYLNRESVAVNGWSVILCSLPLILAVAAATALALNRPRHFVLCAVAVVTTVITGSVVMLLPRLSDELSLKALSLRAAAELGPEERIAFYIKKEYAPVFYSEGRVVCDVGGGDVLNALNPDLLVTALGAYPSLIVITTSRWQGDLEADKRFLTELIATQDESAALRLRLREPQPSP